jgi:hypothetical protein
MYNYDERIIQVILDKINELEYNLVQQNKTITALKVENQEFIFISGFILLLCTVYVLRY